MSEHTDKIIAELKTVALSAVDEMVPYVLEHADSGADAIRQSIKESVDAQFASRLTEFAVTFDAQIEAAMDNGLDKFLDLIAVALEARDVWSGAAAGRLVRKMKSQKGSPQ